MTSQSDALRHGTLKSNMSENAFFEKNMKLA